MDTNTENPASKKPAKKSFRPRRKFNRPLKKDSNKGEKLRIIPLGGLGEVGRNMTILEYGNSALIMDMGFRMPEEDMPGVDYIIPNISYLRGYKKNILGVLFTHGHYDHIGAIPYLIYRFPFYKYPFFASEMTKAIIQKRQEEFPSQPKLDIETIKDGSKIKLGPFNVEFFRQNHNIPDNMGIFINTPIGNIVNTSDFKFDQHPVNEPATNFKKLEEIGRRGILLLMSDSTGAEEEGHSLSEESIFENLEKIFRQAKGRIIAATFSSLLNRIQHLINLSEKYHRKVFTIGHSMKFNIEAAKRLGYLKLDKETLIKKASQISQLPDSQVTILCTGAQGEERAGLMKIATKEHPVISIKPRDTIVFSSSVIPGNERTVQMLKDDLLRQNAEVFHYKMMDIHAGGHAQKEEIKQMIEIMKPKFFLPIHGQYSMLAANKKIAESCGIDSQNISVIENGQIISLTRDKITLEKEEAPSNYVMVDGLGIGNVEEVVLRDRQALSNDGIFVVIAVVSRKTGKVQGSPDIISRGFVYLKESKELLHSTRRKVIDTVEKATSSGGIVNWTYVKDSLRNSLGDFLFQKTQRRPMVLPVIIEV
ncbi:MAG: ribonuclease J [Candidatus Pacebacteria bacterium]|nr:ribonuclease J [Candidatus Paceibacterota bacterium]MDD4875399.1 ribonuclease J [Candidatus Paceibacterota bacterium]